MFYSLPSDKPNVCLIAGDFSRSTGNLKKIEILTTTYYQFRINLRGTTNSS